MTILSNGSVTPSVSWWHGKEAQCPACKVCVRLDAGDDVMGRVRPQKRLPYTAWIQIVCPTKECGSLFELYENPAPQWLPLPTSGETGWLPFPMNEEDFGLIIATLELWKKKLTTPATAPCVEAPASAA